MSTARTKTRRKRHNPAGLLKKFLTVVLLIILVGISFKTYLAWQNRLWTEGTRFTVIVGTNDPTLYSMNRETGKILLARFPEKVQVEASHDYGSWFMGSLWQLGEQEGLGGEILANSVKKAFGIPVDAWMDKRGEALFKEALFLSRMSTNLTFFDRLSVLLAVSKAGLADRQEVDLVSLRVLSKQRFADGVEGYIVVPEQAKVIFEKSLRDDAVFKEGKTVSIVNTTTKSGLAREVARLAGILGLRIINAESKMEGVKDCLIIGGKSELSSLSAKRLAGLLGCSLKEGETSTSQLQIFLGEGFAQRF